MLSREERILSEILVSRGLVARERIEACAAGRPHSGSLIDALVDSGAIDRGEAQRAADEARSLDEALVPELPAGKRLGEFRLIREIGRGGMGIVYEAQQETLGRRVALKVLPAGAALDERLAVRFLREARAAGSLRHPGVVPVYTSGRAEGVLYFAMELIEGRSLAAVIAEGPLPARRAAGIAAEVARALEFAHEAGLVHRDVKPENILVDSDGHARVADFGLVHDTSGGGFTLSRHVLGTPAFIAPEQARGESVDRRSDIYGLGAVLYAMLSGVPPYSGDVPSLVLARVLSHDPADLADLRPELPRDLIAICRRAMERELSLRYPSAAAMADDLERFLRGDPLADRNRDETVRALVRFPSRTGRALVVLLAAGALLALALVLVSRRPPATSPASSSERSSVALLVDTPGRKSSPAVSADGKQMVYASFAAGRSDLFRLELAGGPPVNLTSAAALDPSYPTFAPDGKAIAFASQKTPISIHVVDLESGKIRRLIERPASSLVWSPDGHEVFFLDGPVDAPGSSGASSKLWSLQLATGECRPVTGMYAGQPQISSSSHRIVFTSQGGGQTDLWTISERGGDAIRATNDAALEWSPVWSADGTEVYFGSDRGGASGLWKISLDPSGLPRGAPVRAASAVFPTPFYLARGSARTFVMIGLETNGRLHRLPLDRFGAIPVDGVTAFPDRFLAADAPDVSRDGQWLAYTAVTSQEDLAIDKPDGSEPRLLTHDAFHDRTPRWSSDGSHLAFQSDRSGNMEIWTIRPDGSELTRRTETAGNAALPVWSPDGKRLAYSVEGHGSFVVRADGAPAGGFETLPLPPEGIGSFEPSSWSPDGSSLAGSAHGIVVYSFEDRTYTRFTDIGSRPIWLDDRRLVFTADREIRLLDTRTREMRVVFAAALGGVSPNLGLSADGRTLFASLTASARKVWRIDLMD